LHDKSVLARETADNLNLIVVERLWKKRIIIIIRSVFGFRLIKSGAVRDDAATTIRPPIRNAHDNGLAISNVGNAHHRAKRVTFDGQR